MISAERLCRLAALCVGGVGLNKKATSFLLLEAESMLICYEPVLKISQCDIQLVAAWIAWRPLGEVGDQCDQS